jgi:F-type H+-transporting ATPase subunit gamma
MDTVAQGLAMRAAPELHPLLRENDDGLPVLVVVMGSDRGLCGAFNANINRSVVTYLSGLNGGGPEVGQLLIVGRKPFEFFRRRAFPILDHYADFLGKVSYEDAKQIGNEAIRAYIEGEVGKVVIVYNEFRSALQQRLTTKELLPVRQMEEPEEEEVLLKHEVGYLYEPDVQALLDQVLRRHVHTQLWRALLESMASEHGARMTAMDAATENAVEMIAQLTLQYNRARQAGITTEIIEVVSGADALEG